jgi:phosphatidylserine synthase
MTGLASRRTRLAPSPLRLAAHLATLGVFACGLLALAAHGDPLWVLAWMALATALDGLDGWLARRAGGPTLAGALLDLLGDLAAFGLAPAGLVLGQHPPDPWLAVALLGFLAAALFRLVRSVRRFRGQHALGYLGLPMPAAGWLLASLALRLTRLPALVLAILALSLLAASSRPYPSPGWLWRQARRPALASVAAAGLAAPLDWGGAILLLALVYAAFPLYAAVRGWHGRAAAIPPESEAANPRLPLFLRWVTLIECGVVLGTGLVLFLWPALGGDIWAWAVPPFNARYVGGLYLAAFMPLALAAASGRWAPGRVVLWMILTFTAAVGGVMLFYPDRFAWDRFAAYAFWFLYLFLPLNAAVYLYRLRRLPPALARAASRRERRAQTALAAVLALYGLGLLLRPAAFGALWPYGIDAFHARIYAAIFLAPAVGAWVLRRAAAPSERLALGLSLLVLGLCALLALVLTLAPLPPAARAHYGGLGGWAYALTHAALALIGGLLALRARPQRRLLIPASASTSLP